jgi:hypothetical protein
MTAAPAAYPGPDWALSVLLVNAAAATPLDAVWDDEAEIHTFTVTPAASVLFSAGQYSWYLVATNDTDGLRATIEEGVVDVLPDPVTATPVNAPSHAYRMLAAIEALLESRATAGDVDIVRAAFRDRQMEYDMAGLLQLRRLYAGQVAAEQADAARTLGYTAGMVQVTFQ